MLFWASEVINRSKIAVATLKGANCVLSCISVPVTVFVILLADPQNRWFDSAILRIDGSCVSKVCQRWAQ